MRPKKSAIASKWRAEATRELTLPSGEVVTVRVPGLDVYVKHGRLPATLVSKMAEVKTGSQGLAAASAIEFLNRLEPVEFEAFMLFARELVRAALVSPRIVVRDEGDETPLDDDEVAPGDIPTGDFWALFNWASTADRKIQTARGEVSSAELGNFRPDASIPATSEGGGQVQIQPVGAAGDS
jgi:hypothetical protein